MFSLTTACFSVEEAPYKIIRPEKDRTPVADIEIREYAPQIRAETKISADFEEAGSEAFRKLAAYIFAKKRNGKQKIAMTAPVAQVRANPEGNDESDSNKTVTLTTDATGNYKISFVMPAKYTRLDQLPVPKDKSVKLRQVPRRTMAAVSYRGGWSREKYKSYERALLKGVKKMGLTVKGKPEWGRYDPPFTPWFMRKNEVLVEVTGWPEKSATKGVEN